MMTPPADLSASGMFLPSQTVGTVLCCTCGERIPPNPSNMCVRCLRSRADITAGLPSTAAFTFCPDCSSYLQPPRSWIRAGLESKELLSLCLARIRIPRRLKLVHAEFVWTEPHSKRIKVKIRVQGQIDGGGAILEQSHLVEFVVHDRLCDSCSKSQANPDQWVAKVQVRQHVPHRRTFFYLEQLILKHKAADKAIKIQETNQGLDFMFANRSHAEKFLDFVKGVVPVFDSRSDKSLVSHDSKNNNYNYHYTFSVQICPVCREDLICLPRKMSNDLGSLGPLVVCTKVTNSIMLMDPFTLKTAYLDGDKYKREPFKALLTSRQLVEYIVLDVEEESPEVSVGGSRYCLAQAQVARVSDFGKNDNMFIVRTHLGHLLRPGDYALGYDLYAANGNDAEIEKHKGLMIPEAILIKKSYAEKRQRRRGKSRAWKLKRLNAEVDTNAKGRIDEEKIDAEYEDFLRDLEENPELRFNVSLYQNEEYQPSEMASAVGEDDVPSIPLDELIADLHLSDGEGNAEDNMLE